ncbi:hypothetical protein AB832_03550 [Flavobacteriaceae bacterium (ex Bugula neritina AB1)]|nr:hypothetical protein AB832_03550 [Flavobacteriaceae bacterium (ex Bugula neritina AB1)]
MKFTINEDVFQKIRFLDKYMANHKGFIAGGCFKNIFKAQKTKDIDVWFESSKDYDEALKYFKESKDFASSYQNDNVTAFRDKSNGLLIELIKKIYGSPKEIISKFDFSITRFSYYKNKETGAYEMLYVNSFFEHLVNNKLVIDSELIFPISSFERSYKYRAYGFGLCKTSKEKLIQALQGVSTDNLSKDLYFGLD